MTHLKFPDGCIRVVPQGTLVSDVAEQLGLTEKIVGAEIDGKKFELTDAILECERTFDWLYKENVSG